MRISGNVDALWRRYQETGETAVRDQLVVLYSPLVKYVAGQMRSRLPASVDQDDLISDGVLGLMASIDKFDLERGLKFQTFAEPRIRGAIVDGLRASDWVPRRIREQMRDIQAATADLEHRLQRMPHESEVARELGLSEAELRKQLSQSAYTTLCSIELDHVDDITLATAEGVPHEPCGLPDGVASTIRELPQRDQVIVALYYWERLSLAEIGQVLTVSESRVSQLMTRATLELRRRLAA